MAYVDLRQTEKLNQFLDWISGQDTIRIVRLTDYGFTEPARKNGGWVLQPKVKLVATAFDDKSSTLYRWQDVREAGSTVTIHAFKGRGKHSGREIIWEKERIRQLLMLKGFAVEEGEWEPETIEELLRS